MKKIMVLIMLVAATALSASAQGFGSNSPGAREYRRYRDLHRQQEIYRQQRKIDRQQRRAAREYYRDCPVPNISRGEAPMCWDTDNPYRPFWPAGLSNKPSYFGVTSCGNTVYYNCNNGIQGIGISGSRYIVMKYGNLVSIYRGNVCIREVTVFPGMGVSYDVGGGCLQIAYGRECNLNWYIGGQLVESYLLY